MNMISVQDALTFIRSHRPTVESETVNIGDAAGRALAENASALINMPPFPASNMDGYTVSACKAGDTLTLIGEAAAGHPYEGSVSKGEAVRISTGAMVPIGADRVVIQEDTQISDDRVIVTTAPEIGNHIRPAASDFKEGDPLADARQVLNAADLTLLAAAGHSEVRVARKLKIAIFRSGDELRPVGTQLHAGEIYAANSIVLAQILKDWGAEVTDFGILPDTPNAIAKLIKRLSVYDIIVPIGGASVGLQDHMRAAFWTAGFESLFERIAIRPGKPCWMGKKGRQIVFGLPGNPASAFVCAHLFLKPLIGLKTAFHQAVLNLSLEENGPRETYLRAHAYLDDAQLRIRPKSEQESFRLRPQSNTNALIRLPPLGGPYRAGDRLDIILIGEIGHIE